MQHLEFWPKLCEQRYTQNKNCLPPFFQILYRERGECNIALRGVVSGAVRPVVLPSPHSPSLALEQSMCGHWLKTLFFSAEFAALKFKLQTEYCAHHFKKLHLPLFFVPQNLCPFCTSTGWCNPIVDLCCLTNCAMIYGTPCIAALACSMAL